MAANAERPEKLTTVGVDAVDVDHVVAITIADGAVLLFDEECSTAWMQSSVAVSLDEAA